ncbi:MAG TPA: hypothetical protein VGN57_10890 [Pirellulaceae bacterium]|jgi:hypothetical protein|nr:hypothetical protein [Pirellulaceae bacterium]
MPTIHLIDPSLSYVGDHHFDFASHVMGVAAEQGFQIRLATNRKFRDLAAVPQGWTVHPCFRHHAYNRHSLHHGGEKLLARLGCLKPKRSLQSLLTTPARLASNAWYRRRRDVRLDRFASELAAYWQSVSPQPGDQMILPTVSEFEVISLSRALPKLAGAERVDWHLLFHFNILEGPETELPSQRPLFDWMAATMGDACRTLRSHSLNFYTSNETLQRQYEMLGVGSFKALAYPMNPELAPPRQTENAGPKRILMGGGIRREKGQSRLDRIAADLWTGCLDQGAAQLVVQSGKLGFSVALPAQPAADVEPVVYPPHPLPMEGYRDLIAGAHVGLFLHDRRRYYARRSGVLTDYLCTGLPVIVPAGCWLSEQVQPSVDATARQILARHPQRNLVPQEWLTPSGSDRLECGGSASPATRTLPVAGGDDLAAVTFDWPTCETGTYVTVELAAFDESGRSLTVQRSCGSRPNDSGEAIALFEIPLATKSVRLTWKNAFDDARLLIRPREVSTFSSEGEAPPLGSFGLIAADDEQIGRLVRQMLAHHDHYRREAVAFADEWRRRHHPARTLEQFLASAKKLPRQTTPLRRAA